MTSPTSESPTALATPATQATPTAPATLRGAARLTDWGVISAQGADAKTFLNSQLTQEILSLAPDEARLAGFCSAKGRLQASFVVWRTAPDQLFLACSADLLQAVMKRLSMFILRAKCKLSDATSQVTLWGVAGYVSSSEPTAAALPRKPWRNSAALGGTYLSLPAAMVDGQSIERGLLVLEADASRPVMPEMSLNTWQWLEVMSGTARIVAATAEQFVPQMINFELVGGVNFQKGCYPGQEIVARSQYRGSIKRRAFVFDSPQAAQVGQDVFSSADPDQPAGLVVLAASAGSRHSALVELKLSAVEGGVLTVGSVAGQRLTLVDQPYAIPAANA